jgi:hypothetical protein
VVQLTLNGEHLGQSFRSARAAVQEWSSQFPVRRKPTLGSNAISAVMDQFQTHELQHDRHTLIP